MADIFDEVSEELKQDQLIQTLEKIFKINYYFNFVYNYIISFLPSLCHLE